MGDNENEAKASYTEWVKWYEVETSQL
jgi:hypothetical protein